MRLSHFAALQPLCPRCLRRGTEARLALAAVWREEGGAVLEGVLHCPDSACRSEYPVVDGIPLLVADLRDFCSRSQLSLLGRSDLGPELEGLLGDCLGPGSAQDSRNQVLSTYAFDHWGDLDPAGTFGGRPGSARELLGRLLDMAGAAPEGPALDAGCAAGRTSFALAGRVGGLVLGADLNLDLLRLAQAALLRGRAAYPLRRAGIAYERRAFAVAPEHAERVDYWCLDAAEPPFAPGTFGLAASLNLVDCVASPLGHLSGLERVLRPGGKALLCTPYDWSCGVTPPEGWFGGHSQRGEAGGDPAAVLRSLLAEGGHPAALAGLRLAAEAEARWRLRLHDRSSMDYAVHLVVAERA
ncbi:MAG: methyltransferase domain-containing protein [Thermodesulfobacteriota bacterium]